MEHILLSDYTINVKEKVHLRGKEGFRDNEYLYFTIPSSNKEVIHMEQAALAYYLYENNYSHMARPIPTIRGDWFFKYDQNLYMIVKVDRLRNPSTHSHGSLLANFHQLGSAYSYEPQEISSYGQWKQLWIDKLSVFEANIQEEAKHYHNRYYRIVMDILPYIIGISENAIQYMQESKNEGRYHDSDQATISFQRYRDNLLDQVIWVNDLIYDHPTRDLAEYIRVRLMQTGEEGMIEIKKVIHDYQTVRPISIFSWRLLYARLIYPIHFFDCLEKGFSRDNFEAHYQTLIKLIEKQTLYERRLGQLFEFLDVDTDAFNIPVLHWM